MGKQPLEYNGNQEKAQVGHVRKEKGLTIMDREGLFKWVKEYDMQYDMQLFANKLYRSGKLFSQ